MKFSVSVIIWKALFSISLQIIIVCSKIIHVVNQHLLIHERYATGVINMRWVGRSFTRRAACNRYGYTFFIFQPIGAKVKSEWNKNRMGYQKKATEVYQWLWFNTRSNIKCLTANFLPKKQNFVSKFSICCLLIKAIWPAKKRLLNFPFIVSTTSLHEIQYRFPTSRCQSWGIGNWTAFWIHSL